MKHLRDVNMNYFQHLGRAWGIAVILVVHGIYPDVWRDKASKLLCK